MNFILVFAMILSASIVIISLLFFLEIYKNKNENAKSKENKRMSDKVAEEMAKKIISEAKLHRKNGFSNDT